MSTHQIPKRETSRYAGQYAGPGDPSRLVDIFTDSHRLALSSKNPETATTRFELAVEAYYQIMSMSVTEQVRTSVHRAMSDLAEQFPVQVVLNEAAGLREKAAKLRTAKKKIELLQRAQDALEKGLTGNPGSAAIQDALAQIRDETSALKP